MIERVVVRIEDNIPIPPVTRSRGWCESKPVPRGVTALARKLAVGQSFLLPGVMRSYAIGGCLIHAKPFKFTMRKTPAGVRIWRIA